MLKNKSLLLLLSLLAIVFMVIEYHRGGDFSIYLKASSSFFQKENIYNNFYGIPEVFKYYGSPFLTLLLYPLSLLPSQVSLLLFKLLNIILLGRVFKLIENYFDLENIKPKQYYWWFWLGFLFLSFPVYANFHVIQLTIILLFCMLEGIHQIRDKNRPLLGALIISIGIFVKVTPVVMVPYLLYRNQLKGVALTLVVLITLLLLPALFLGWEQNVLLWQSWLQQISLSSTDNTFDMNNSSNSGISALLSSLFIEGIKHVESDIEVRRHIVSLQPEIVKTIILFARLFLVSFMLYFLRTKPFKKQDNKMHQIWEISYLLLVILLIFPQQRPYNFILLLPAVFYICYLYFIAKTHIKNRTFWVSVLLILAVLFINLELILGHFREYYWHFKILTYGTLMLLVLLAKLKPKTLKNA